MTPPDTDALLVDALVAACRRLAHTIVAGGRLLVVGVGLASHDAAHVAVEFTHPVIVGKRHVAAVHLGADAATSNPAGMAALGRPGDLAIVIADDDAGLPTDVMSALAERGIDALVIGPDGGLPSAARVDAMLVYHLLWEGTHHVLEAEDRPSTAALQGGLGQMYPGLSSSGAEPDDALRDSLLRKLVTSKATTAQAMASLGEAIREAGVIVRRAADSDGTVLVAGNGGSATDALVLAGALGTLDPPVAARALVADIAHVTAVANDVGIREVFARAVHATARPGDVLVLLSTSGGSPNLLAAASAASSLGIPIVASAGYGGGELANLAGEVCMLPIASTSVHRIQEAQGIVLAALTDVVRWPTEGASASSPVVGQVTRS